MLNKAYFIKAPPQTYCKGFSGILAQVLLLQNRFKSILSNFHLTDRGLNSI
jgi:hypothetical protein